MSLSVVCQSVGTGVIVVSALFWLGAACMLALGLRRLKSLADAVPLPNEALPSLTLIAAAKDEADRIEGAVRSFLTQDYPGLRIIVVDDRSVDGTGAILDRIALGAPRLQVIHVHTLPAGWIGKCHALARASAAAKTDWLLFTDGDIELAPDAVRRAVSFALQEKLDHLAVAPDMIVESLGEAVFIGYFLAMFYLSQQPWRAPNQRAKSSIGIGAFNLVRRAAYERSGGHERIRYEMIDDLGLGRILKQSGERQMLALHGGAVRAISAVVRPARGGIPARLLALPRRGPLPPRSHGEDRGGGGVDRRLHRLRRHVPGGEDPPVARALDAGRWSALQLRDTPVDRVRGRSARARLEGDVLPAG